MQMIVNGRFLQSFYQENTYTLFVHRWGDSQRPFLSRCERIKVRRSASQQLRPGAYNREISDVLRHFKLCPRQHNALGRVSVDQSQKRGNV